MAQGDGKRRPGDDVLLARDGIEDIVMCGPGDDVAVVDELDLVRGCEAVTLVRMPQRGAVPSPRAPSLP